MLYLPFPDSKKQKIILDYFFSNCDSYCIMYPNDGIDIEENPLTYGKTFFLNLHDVEIKNWNGMKDGIQIVGLLCDAVNNFIFEALEKRGIWHFSLCRKGKPVFSVNDFDTGILEVSAEEVEEMLLHGIFQREDILL